MKITKNELDQIIKEEVLTVFQEGAVVETKEETPKPKPTRRPRTNKETAAMRDRQNIEFLKRTTGKDWSDATTMSLKDLRRLNKGKFEEADQNLDSDGDVIDLDYLGDIYSDIYKELYNRRPRHEMFKTEKEAQEAIDKLLVKLRSRREEGDDLVQMDMDRQGEEDEIQSLMPDPLDQEDLPLQTGFGKRMEAVDKIYNIIKEKINSDQNFYEVDAKDVNEEYCPVCTESQELEEKKKKKKKKKACKPAKGKRFAKRVNGKCRSYGQAGKAKSGGDRIRPGTAKGDAYCARSAKIKKCKNPPCANTLSRKKWKCQGSKSVA
jgi:hypothetical protein